MIRVNSTVRLKRPLLASAAFSVLLVLGACTTAEVLNQGYIVDERSLELVPVGSSREQVLLALGSPSTTATFDNEVFYYISQKRVRPVAFMEPQLVDQRVLAVYFDGEGRVANIANYGLQNGQLFDFISRTTPTGGRDASFLGQILTDTTSGAPGPRLPSQ
ncbi:outer membrane protein assembly factor BamE [Aurantimonas aggregata]|uniref:Outer membrane protein assembly factor BamE n=1 Tax=Aurantimonas aggregata TaxID=2047720 RepID=A0A6L9MGK5_9HYPH|nr:outer membrane protein assembly factor BamE [Aurantimonas aggregata]NDV86933.1 outer membrane protein assembly factor BamE [Aurantimonas aggregata]